MKISENEDWVYAMRPLQRVSWFVGTWPLQEYTLSSFLRAAWAVGIQVIMLMITFLELSLDMSDTEKDMNALMLVTCGVLSISKIVTFRYRAPGLIFNYNSAVKDYNNLRLEENRKIMRRHARMGRIACATVITFSYSSSFLLAVQSVMAGIKENVVGNVTIGIIREYPAPSDNVIALLKIPDSMYLTIFIVEFYMLIICCTGNLGNDSLFFAISFHLCAQAKILSGQFSALVNDNKTTLNEFNTCIKRHIYLLELGGMLNDTISSILLVQIFSSSALICITGFQLIYAAHVQDFTIGLKSIVILSNFSMQLFVYSFVGDYIKSQMDGIGFALYSSRWEEFPKAISKDIIFVIMRTQRSFHLLAGKHFMVNIETYASILKASMSYLSVLRVMLLT